MLDLIIQMSLREVKKIDPYAKSTLAITCHKKNDPE